MPAPLSLPTAHPARVLPTEGSLDIVPPHPTFFGPTTNFGVHSTVRNVLDVNAYGGPECKGNLNDGEQGKEITYTFDEMRDKAVRGDWNEATSYRKSKAKRACLMITTGFIKDYLWLAVR